ncbi:MAG: CPBP family intramembrane glutamic endopeptidase [Candidatus Hydrothermarchaeales archaeon]
MKLATLFIIGIIVSITVLEYIFVYTSVSYGILLALFLTIAIYILISLPEKENEMILAAESLALLPLYVLFTSSLPWFFVKQSYLLPAIYTIILGLCAWHIYDRGIGMHALGLTRENAVKYALMGALIGIPTGAIEYLVLKPSPAFPAFEIAYFFRDFAYMTLFVALGEELLFRAIVQLDLQKAFGDRNGLLMAAYLFGVMHLTWRSPTELAFAFFAGYLLGYIYYKTGSLMGPIMLHGINNTMLVAVMPYLLR